MMQPSGTTVGGGSFSARTEHQPPPSDRDAPSSLRRPTLAHTQRLEQVPADAMVRDSLPPALANKIRLARSVLDNQRRHVTVLFADLANYTSIAEQLED